MASIVLNVDQNMLNDSARVLAEKIRANFPQRDVSIYGVPRGGIPAMYLVCSFLQNTFTIVSKPELANVIIDDLVDSGSTRERYLVINPDALFFTLFEKKTVEEKQQWYVFPWERSELESTSDIPLRLLQYIGEDSDREGLRDTPERFLKAWKFYTQGYQQKPEDFMKSFEDGSEDYDSMITMKNIRIYSHCEHHLAPFWGFAHIAYIPTGKIIGISKLARVAHMFARRLQVQERLTMQIAQCLMKMLEPKGVAVVLKCRHMCMEARGVQSPGTYTTTSALRGSFKENSETRMEFFKLIEDSTLEV